MRVSEGEGEAAEAEPATSSLSLLRLLCLLSLLSLLRLLRLLSLPWHRSRAPGLAATSAAARAPTLSPAASVALSRRATAAQVSARALPRRRRAGQLLHQLPCCAAFSRVLRLGGGPGSDFMSASARAGAARERGSSGAPSRAARYAAVAADCAVSITASPRAPDGCLRAAIPDDSGGRCPCGLLLPERRPTQACTSSPEATGVPGTSVRSSAISQIPDLQPGLRVWVNPKGARIANLGVLR